MAAAVTALGRGPAAAIPAGHAGDPGPEQLDAAGPLGRGARPDGQSRGVAGRVSGIAIAPGGSRLYVATANGGVWRSDDGGLSWSSTDGRIRR